MTQPKPAGGRRSDPAYKQMNLNLAPDLIKRLKHEAIEQDLNISQLAEIIFEKWLCDKRS